MPTTDERRFEELLDGLQSTADDMALVDSPDFVPILQAPGWRGRRATDCARLLAGVEDAPLIALGRDLPEACVYLPKQKQRACGLDLKKLHKRARRNLKRRPGRAAWERIDVPEAELRLLAREGDALTASDILDRGLLQEAARLLQTEVVYVGIPSRHTMVAAADPWSMLSFVPEQHARAEEEGRALSAQVYVWTDGRLQGIVEPKTDTGPAPAPRSGSGPRPRARRRRRPPARRQGTLERIGNVARTIRVLFIIMLLGAALSAVM